MYIIVIDSVNFFWFKKNKPVIATAGKDLNCPIIYDITQIPTERLFKKRFQFICNHEHSFSLGEKQIRRGDEAKSEIFECLICKKHKLVK